MNSGRNDNLIILPESLGSRTLPLEAIEEAFQSLFRSRSPLIERLRENLPQIANDKTWRVGSSQRYTAPRNELMVAHRERVAAMLNLEVWEQDIERERQIEAVASALQEFETQPNLRSALRLKTALSTRFPVSEGLDPLDLMLSDPVRLHLDDLTITKASVLALKAICWLSDDEVQVWNALYLLFVFRQSVNEDVLNIFGRYAYFNTLCCQLAPNTEFTSRASREDLMFNLAKVSDRARFTADHFSPLDELRVSEKEGVQSWIALNVNSRWAVEGFLRYVGEAPANDETIIAALRHITQGLERLRYHQRKGNDGQGDAVLAAQCSAYFINEADSLSASEDTATTILYHVGRLQSFDLIDRKTRPEHHELSEVVLEKVSKVYAEPDKKAVLENHTPDFGLRNSEDNRILWRTTPTHVFVRSKALSADVWFPIEFDRVKKGDLGNWMTLLETTNTPENYDALVAWMLEISAQHPSGPGYFAGVEINRLFGSLLSAYPEHVPIEGIRLQFLTRMATAHHPALFHKLGFTLLRVLRQGHPLPGRLRTVLEDMDPETLTTGHRTLRKYVLNKAVQSKAVSDG